MDVFKEKLDKWSTGWRLILGVVGPVVAITVWALTQTNNLKIEILTAVHEMKSNLEEVRNEMSESNLVYHARVDGIEEKAKDLKEVNKFQWEAIRRLRER